MINTLSMNEPFIPQYAPGRMSPREQRKKRSDSLGSQESAHSTVASECDLFHFRLQPVPEVRGWKYFFKHTIRVPLAFAVGMILGGLLVAMVFIGHSKSLPSAYTISSPPAAVPEAYMSSTPFNNSCLMKHLKIPDGPQTFDACAFVIQSTDEVWNTRGSLRGSVDSARVEAAIDKYFNDDYLDAGSWGRRIIGKGELRKAIFSEMQAFPDIQIHITDCVCKGNDNDGYKCAMPDVLTGTNLGPSAYGPATGRFARWTGLVESFVKFNPVVQQWQYYAEWGVHDEWALIQQLGLDFARVPHPRRNDEPLHDCDPLLSLGWGPNLDQDDALMTML